MAKIGIIRLSHGDRKNKLDDYDYLTYETDEKKIHLRKAGKLVAPEDYDLLILTILVLKNMTKNIIRLIGGLMEGKTKLIFVLDQLIDVKEYLRIKGFPLMFGPSTDPFYDPYDLYEGKYCTIVPKRGSIILSTDRGMGVVMACSQRIAICMYDDISTRKLITLMIQGPMPQLTPAVMPIYPISTRGVAGALFHVMKALRMKIPRPILWIIINMWYFAP